MIYTRTRRRPIKRLLDLALVSAGLLACAALLPERAGLSIAQATAPSWSYTGFLNTPRNGHTATLLPNGKVLVAGGNGDGTFLNSAELYDPATGTWSYTGSLNTARRYHTATLLPNGKVLVTGGLGTNGAHSYLTLNTAELYDPATGTWSVTGNLNRSRQFQTATLLPNSKVLVAGGFDTKGINSYLTLNTAELYDPATGTWSGTGSLNVARGLHTATLLPNGKVLVAGGNNTNGINSPLTLNSAELYDPATGRWSATGSLNVARSSYTATLLPNGTVLVTGGNGNGDLLNGAELYDPATETWDGTGNLNTSRDFHTATLLQNSNVLVVGGFRGDYDFGIYSAELYDFATGTWTNADNVDNGGEHTATLLLNGQVLIAGGFNDGSGNSAILYNSGNSSVPNPIDDSQFFIRQQYLDFLNREPDQGGSDYWTSQITECGTNQQCIHDRRIAVSAAFFIEQEFQDTGYFVYRFYKASLGRQPNYAEFTSDRSKVIGGDDLETRKQAFVAEWTQRPGFLQQYPLSMSAEDFVNKLFDTAQLMSSTTERKQEMDALNDNIKTRSQVLRDVVEMQEFETREYNGAFVRMQYFGYLRRDPDTGGESFWLDVLNNRLPQDGSGYRSMVCAFITSTEYQLRFGTVITRSNQDCTP
ncbi:MAG: hypothetical protein AUG51_07990 [Acidobacteria bacterium 13_1_20CM_3_53_8]|nr:MAG: hypothetical protein AUG51_07990 [Acidobacteria bacterium 13_1_20CM_3_53_8]